MVNVPPHRKPCRSSHDLQSDHNSRLLKECSLQQLNEDELFLLLLLNDPALLPEVTPTPHSPDVSGCSSGDVLNVSR